MRELLEAAKFSWPLRFVLRQLNGWLQKACVAPCKAGSTKYPTDLEEKVRIPSVRKMQLLNSYLIPTVINDYQDTGLCSSL